MAPTNQPLPPHNPRTPVVVAQTKKIDTTAAECADMNRLLQRLEWGKIDLQSQLDIIESDSILCGLQNLAATTTSKFQQKE